MQLFRRQRKVSGGEPPPDLQPTAEVRGATVVLSVGGPPPPTDTPPDWDRSGVWLSWEPPLNAVRGESHYQDALLALAGEPPEAGHLLPVAVALVRDPDNPYDPNALRAELDGTLVGHIARDLAALLSPAMDSAGCAVLTVPGLVRGGSVGAPSIGVHLWLRRRLSAGPDLQVPEDLARTMKAPWPPVEALDGDDTGDPVIDDFYHLERQIERAWSGRDCAQVVLLAKRSIAMLGGFLRGGGDVHELSAVSVAGPVLAAFGDRDGLLAMRAALDADPRLRQFVPEADAALAAEALTSSILSHVRANPGTLQRDVYKVLGADKAAVQTACYMAETVGRLHREKSGVSYALRVPEAS